MTHPSLLLLILIGVAAGLLAGVFGIGGGIIIVPALVYLAGFDQLTATGTSLTILLPPLGLAAMFEFYRRGQVNFRAAIIIAICLFLASWLSAHFVGKVPQVYLRIGFGVFIIFMGILIVVTNWARLPKI